MHRWLAWGSACLLCLASFGCGGGGPELGQVTGQVTMDGEPLPNAVVTFSPVEGGRSSIGRSDASGKYELIYLDRKGATLGEHRVSVTSAPDAAAPAPDIPTDSEEYEKQALGGSLTDYHNASPTESIPTRYNSETELKETVTAGANVIDLKLESGG
jgi:hypothetical protein